MIDEPVDFTPDTATTVWSIAATVTGLVALGSVILAVVIA